MKKNKSLFKKVLITIGFFIIFFIVLIIAFGIYISADKVNFQSSFHPFKSKVAKETYLKVYDERSKKWPVQSETKMIITTFGKTFVRISGSKDNKPLVLMHGMGGNSLQWLSNIKTLSQYYQVFAIDNIYDNGRSVNTKIIENEDDYTLWLDETLEKLELNKNINMIGLSYGGWITAQYALKFPNKLDKAVLLAPVGTIMPLSIDWIIKAIPVAIPIKYFTQNFMYWLAKDTIKSGEKGKKLIDEHIDESFLAVKSFNTRKMVNPTVLTDTQLQKIKIPTLFIVGENEKIYSAKEAIKRLSTVAPKIRTKTIKNAGHDLTIIKAEEVNSLIIDFLK